MEPASETDAVNAAGFGQIDFELVTLGFALFALEPKAKTGVGAFALVFKVVPGGLELSWVV